MLNFPSAKNELTIKESKGNKMAAAIMSAASQIKYFAAIVFKINYL